MIESVGMALKKKHIIYLKLMCTKSKCEPANDAMRNFITARGKDSGNQNPFESKHRNHQQSQRVCIKCIKQFLFSLNLCIHP